MTSQGNGLYSRVVTPGDTLCEQFYIAVVKGDDRKYIYPIVDLAPSHLRVEGPSTDFVRDKRCWQLDGRASYAGELASPSYRISLEWHGNIKRISWETTNELPTETGLSGDSVYANRYFLTGTFLR